MDHVHPGGDVTEIGRALGGALTQVERNRWRLARDEVHRALDLLEERVRDEDASRAAFRNAMDNLDAG